MIELRDIEEAAKRLENVVVKTPLLQSVELDEIAGGKVLLKPECFQTIGSFKIRGAYNLMSQLNSEQARKGVIAWSSGNHAQGVALAGQLLGIKTAIVMPEDAPKLKLERTRRLGAEIILYDRYTGDREAIARGIAAERGAVVVPSYDSEHIVSGQGTIGLEIMQQSDELGLPPDQVLVGCGGGGVSSGVAVAVKALSRDTDIYAVEPEEFDNMTRSLRDGVRRGNAESARSICDALLSETPGELPFAIHQALGTYGLTVSDAEVRAAVRFAFLHLKIVVEPGGAVSLAAILADKVDCTDKTTAIVLTGGNIDPNFFSEIQNEI